MIVANQCMKVRKVLSIFRRRKKTEDNGIFIGSKFGALSSQSGILRSDTKLLIC